jgi:hypothetical protein
LKLSVHIYKIKSTEFPLTGSYREVWNRKGSDMQCFHLSLQVLEFTGRNYAVTCKQGFVPPWKLRTPGGVVFSNTWESDVID